MTRDHVQSRCPRGRPVAPDDAVRPLSANGRRARVTHSEVPEGVRGRDDAVRRRLRQQRRRLAGAEIAGRLLQRRRVTVAQEECRPGDLQAGRQSGQAVHVPGDPAGELAVHRPAGHVPETAQVHQAADVHAGRAQTGHVDHVHREGAPGRGRGPGAPGPVVRQGPGAVGRVVRPAVRAAGVVRPIPDDVLRPPGADRRVPQSSEADDGRARLQAAENARDDGPGRRRAGAVVVVVDVFRRAAVPERCGADTEGRGGTGRRRVSGRAGPDQRPVRGQKHLCSGARKDVRRRGDERGAKRH